MRSAKTLAAVALLSISPFASGQPAAFSPESIIVSRVGTTASTLSGTGNEVYLDEYSSWGNLIRSVPLPTSSSGTNRRLVVAGDSISEGGLSRSVDGRYLIVSGYDAAIPYPVNVSGTAGTSIRRIIGRVDHEANVDTTTALTDFASTGVPRSVVSMDGSAFWMVGSKGGVRYAPLGATGSILLNNDAANPSHLGLFGGWLYLSTDGGSPRISSVGMNLPTTSGQTLNGLPGFPETGSPDGFFLADLSSSVSGFDTLYVADDTIGLQKFSLVNAIWVYNGIIGLDTDDYRSLTAKVTNNGIVLYSIRKALGAAGGGELVKLTDASGYNGAFFGVPTVLTTAPAGSAFRGVSLAPSLVPDLTVGLSGPTHVTTYAPFDYTFTVTNTGSAPATDITVRFTVPSGLVVEAGPDADGFTGPGAAEYEPVVEFTGGSLAQGASATLILTCSADADGTFLTAPGTPSVDPGGLIEEGNEENNGAFVRVRTVASSTAPEPSVFTWNDSVPGSWSDPTRWTNELASGTAPNANGGANYILNFDASGSFSAVNNLTPGFSLNQMNFSGSNVIDISGQQFEFTEDGALFPGITQNGTVETRVSSVIGSTQDLTVAVHGTNPLTLSGGIFGDGSLIKTGPGRLLLTAPTTYAGTTVIQAGTLALTDAGGPNRYVIADGSFERPKYGAEGWGYTPDFTGWTMTGTSGVASSYTPWVDDVDEGAQVAFLQGEPSSISQSITISTPGRYQLSFRGANRPDFPANGVIVRINGVQVGSWDHTQFEEEGSFVYQDLAMNLAVGVHTIEFIGWSTAGGDTATAIDDVTLTGPIGSLPANSAVDLTSAGATLNIEASDQTIFALTGVAGSSIINNGELTVDTAASTSFGGVISGSGELIKAGAGTLTLSGINLYTGDTRVYGEGTLVLNEPTLSDTAGVFIGDNATLQLNFAGTDIVAGISLGESQFGPGIYNASNSFGRITGTGSIEVVTPPYVPDIALEIPPGTDLASGGTQDFGIIGIGTPGDDTRIFHIRNEGNAELYLDAFLLGVYGVHAADFEVFTNGFTDDYYYISLSPGATGTIMVRFTPTAPGTRIAELLIYSDDPDEGIQIVNLTGGSPQAPAFTIQPGNFNIASNSLVNFSVAASGVPAPDFQWYLGASGDDSNPISGATSTTFLTPAITANTSYWVRATNASGFADSDTASITVNPLSLAEIDVSEAVGQVFTGLNNGDPLDFGNGTLAFTIFPPIKTIRVANFGSEALENIQVTVTGPDAADFGVTLEGIPDNFPTTIAPGNSGFFTVFFTPTAEGLRTATLNISSNDANENPFTLTLTGNGTVPTPLATTNPATGVTASAATLRGSVNPNGNATITAFEFGTTTAYGTTLPISLSPDDGTAEQSISAFINGLTTGQTYHFRASATNAWGTTYGADQSFVAGSGSNDFTYTNSDDQLTITGYTGPGGAVVIPSTIEGLPVVNIGNGAFSGKTSITSVVIPEGVIIIGMNAFSYCSNMTSVTIPNTVTYIGSAAFRGCSAVTSLFIPQSVNFIELFAFDFMYSLTGFTVDAANPNYSSLDGVLFNKSQTTLLVFPGGQAGPYTIPSSVTRIESFAFYRCTELTGVTLPDGLQSIGYGAFEDCDGITSLNIPASVTSVQPGSFSDCNSLPSITVTEPNGSYTSQDGVLFNDDLTELIQYPAGKSGNYTVPSTVTSIAAVAFINADNLTGVILPDGLNSLGSGAFYSCGALQFVNIPGGVTSIGPTTFTYCSSLATVVLSEGLLEIGYSAFEGCSSLTSIIIPSTVTSIGNQAFMICTQLSSAVFLGAAPAMGTNVFQFAGPGFQVGYLDANEAGFLAPTWPGYPVVNLGIAAPEIRVEQPAGPELASGVNRDFGGRVVEESADGSLVFTIRNSGTALLDNLQVTRGGNHPFDFWVDLTGFPAELAPGAFAQFTVYFSPFQLGARNATLSIASNDANENPFLVNLSGTGVALPFTYTSEDSQITITGYTGPGGAVTVPAMIDGLPVVAIGNYAFFDNDSITSIVLPEGILSIGLQAFLSCDGLTELTLPASVTSIGQNAFAHCNNIPEIAIPANVETIEVLAFAAMTGLTQFTVDPLNANFSTIDGVLFNADQTTLIQYPAGRSGPYTIPVGVTHIQDYAFSHTLGLTSIDITSDVTSVGHGAFEKCSALTNVAVPASVVSIGGAVFANCPSLLSIDVDGLNANYESVNGVLFDDGLTTLIQYPAGKPEISYEIPATVETIGHGSFSGASFLTGVTMPAGLSFIDGSAFSDCTSLESVVIPDGVTIIRNFTFGSCRNLTSVTLPAGLTIIESYAFYDCEALLNITIPGSVTDIEEGAFLACDILQTATFLGAAPVMGARVFDQAAVGFYVGYFDAFSAGFIAPTWPGYPVTNLGTPAPEIRVSAGGPDLVSGDFLLFGNVLAGSLSGATRDLTIRNVGNAPLTDFAVTIDGPNLADFSVNSSGLPTSLPPGASGQISVTFTPTATGARLATLIIESNDEDASPITLEVSGNGTSIVPFAYRIEAGEVYITGYTGPDGAVVVPGTIAGRPVVGIDEAAFNGKSGLTSLLLPDGIRIIGPSAFGGCSALTAFTIPTSVTFIGSNAFSGCDNITQLEIPANVTTIEIGAFNFMGSFTQFTVDPLNTNYSAIDGVLFDFSQTVLLQYPGGRSGLYSLPAGVTRIERSAFGNAVGLTGITFTDDLTNIGAYAFGNTGLTNVAISANVGAIGAGAFSNCASLTSIDVVPLNGNFESVGGVLFNEDQSTLIQYPTGKVETSYTVPASVTAISESAFFSARNLIAVVMPPGLLTIGSFAFYDCRDLESVVIPASVTRINIQTFAYCNALESVTLSEGLINLGPYAFLSCGSLVNITIPASVSVIEYNAFLGCGRLETATFLGNAPNMGEGVFDGVDEFFFAGYYAPFEAGFLAPSWPDYDVFNLGNSPPPPTANLANLQVSAGVLTPAFVPAVTAYSVSVANSVNTIALTPTPVSNAATVRINGFSVVPGVPSSPLPLDVGNNVITTVVTAENGTTTKTYTLTVSRAPSAIIATQPAQIGANRTILLRGTVIPNGVATVYFEYGVPGAFDNVTTPQVFQGAFSENFSATLSGLPFATGFTYRAVATGVFGTLRGTEQTFTTVQAPPIAATGDPTAVSNSAATLVGAVDPRGLLTEVYFEYGLTIQYGKRTQVRMVTTAGGFQDFLSPSEGLIPDAFYHYRIVATNEAGTTFGNDVTFRVAVGSGVTDPIPSTPPTLGKRSFVGLTSDSAILQGTVNPNRGTTVVQFQIGTTTAYGRATAVQGVGNGTDPVDVSIPVSGLIPGTTYQYRMIAGNSAGASVGENQEFTTKPAPPSAVTGDAEVISTTRVRINGSVKAGAATASAFIDFGTDPFALSGSIQATPATASGATPVPVTAELVNLGQGLIYYYRVRAVGPEGAAGVGATRSFQVALLSGLIQQFPDAVPLVARQGALSVVINPALPASGWRFFGEKPWRASGSPATGLTSGDRVIEFRPVAGFIQPPNETAAITSNGIVSSLVRSYTPSNETGSGAVNVTLRPEGLTEEPRPFELMAKWAMFGEVDAQGDPVWRDSGTSKGNLLPGNHVIIAKTVTGRSTPLPVTVRIRNGETTSATITYYVAEDQIGTPPVVVDFDTVSNSAKLPYAYTGQLRSDAGAGSGFVVRPGVVATAAHVMFDDGTLSSATNMQWLHRHDQQAHDPVPLIPRGYFMLTGYAAQRAADNSPGSSTPQSQNLDVAAAYFLSDPGSGGFSGYLASDSTGNEFLLSSALKTLLGYPVEGTPEADINRMHQSPPSNITFTQGFGKTYITSDVRSSGGGSGGPLCVQYENGNYYPAAIYLGGTAQTVVRALDSSVADLIGFAEASAALSTGETDGEITQSDNVAIANPVEGELEVIIESAAAREAGAGWRIRASSPYLASGARLNNLTPNTYTIQFASVPGFVPPTPQAVVISAGFRKRITFAYQEIVLPPVIGSSEIVTGTRGQPFSYQIDASNSPDAFSLLGGIPVGLSFDSDTGIISGNPGEAGVFDVLIGAENSGGADSKPLSITSLPALNNQTVKVPFNQPMSYTIVCSESGEGVEFGSGVLPKGLSLNSATGLISGIPQDAGTFNVPIQVSRRGATAGSVLQMDFTDSPPLIVGESNLNPTVPYGGDASFSVSATGSPEPAYQWYRGTTGSLVEPIIGANFSFFTTPPSTTETSYWVRVSNNSGFVDSSTFTVSVLPSGNANLADLIPSAGTLSPSFNAGISAYTLAVPHEVLSISLSPFAEIPQTTVTINGSTVLLESTSAPMDLGIGLNNVVVLATAGDGVATKTYNISVTRGAAPTLETGLASDISYDAALLNGKAKPNGKAIVFFEYGLDETYGLVTPRQEISGNSEIEINAPLFGLLAETIYHFRIGITTGAGTIYGQDETFETIEAPPLVATGDAKDSGANRAKLIGAVDSGNKVISVYFQWGETILYGNTTVPQQVPASTNVTDIQFTAEGLIDGNTYYYRLVAETPEGIKSYGENKTFVAGQANPTDVIPDQTPVATTGAATDITTGSANLLGTVDPNGGTTFARFEYGLTETYGSFTGSKAVGNGEDSATVLIPVNGLLPGRTYHYRLVASNSRGAVNGQNQTFTTKFPAPLATTGGASPLSPTSARITGTVRPRGNAATAVFEYGTDGITFPNSIQATPGTVSGDTEVEVKVDLTNLEQRKTYFYRLTASRPDNPASATTGEVRKLEADALIGLVQTFTREVPVASRESVVTVNLSPAGIGAWRFVGETDWRASGVQVGGLTNGDRLIEYLPAPGYIQPPREQVGIVNGEDPQVIERIYYQTTEAGSATIKVVLGPDSISATSVPVASRAQWRLAGESAWRDSNSQITGLSPGGYLVEFKPIPGRNTPPGAGAELSNGQTSTVTIAYPPANAPILNPPVVVPFATASTARNFPYAFVGQFRTDAGSQSGFVVKPRVVATTSLAIFNDSTLTRNTGMQWLLQRDNGTYEPTPQVPRGTYVFTGYEAQRATENTPGTLSMASQNLNVAALYFTEDAGRGGFSGYLSSGSQANEFLQSPASKTMVGYPVNGVSEASQGRMHATPLSVASFTWELGRTYSSSAIRGLGGMEGGPLCVQFQKGSYLPAAIYLGGTSRSIVRAIDGDVVDMFNRAEISSNGGDNNTGGGITHSSFTSIGATTAAALKVTIQPTAARDAGAGWRLNPETSYRLSGSQKTGLNAGTYTLELKSVTGFETPPKPQVSVTSGQLREITFTYQEANVAPTINNLGNQSINEDSVAGPLAITLFDADDAETSLSLTGTSSNTTLVPNANIGFAGSGANRTVTVTPVANLTGNATITLTVSDGKITDTDTFIVTFNPVNDPPTISAVPNQSTTLNTSTTVIPVTIGDVETPLASLALTGASSNIALVPVSGIVFGGSNANRNVTIMPASGWLGTAVITLSVSDGSSIGSRAFTVTVTGDAMETWRFANFNTANNSGAAGNNADPDGDGADNISEYAAGTNPNSATDVFTISASTRVGTSFSSVFRGKAGRSYSLQRRPDLEGGVWEITANSGPLAVDQEVTLTDLNAISNRGFYRVMVELNSP